MSGEGPGQGLHSEGACRPQGTRPWGRVAPSEGTGLALQLPAGPWTRMGVALGSPDSGRVGLCQGGTEPEGHPTHETPAPCTQRCAWGGCV